MENIIEKINSLKSMANGLNSNEGKAVNEIVSLLSDLVEEVRNLKVSTESVAEQVDAIDEDLANLEEEFYEDECDCGCDESVDSFEIACPYCEETVEIKFDVIDDKSQFECPKCHQLIELDFECEDGCDCGCGCEDEEEECGGDCDCHNHK